MDGIRIVVAGAAGKMGREVIRGLGAEKAMQVVGAVDRESLGADSELLAGGQLNGVPVTGDLAAALRNGGANVLLDFTHPDAVAANLRTALKLRVAAVVGTTGLRAEERAEFHQMAIKQGVGVVVAPNFALGAVLLMQFAAQAARYFPAAEISERHHPGKADAPSGTAILIADYIARGRTAPAPGTSSKETITGVRGGKVDGTPIHCQRLPGVVAHHEVAFGGPGEILTLRHDSLGRESFLPGIMLALRKVREQRGLVYGLEALLD